MFLLKQKVVWLVTVVVTLLAVALGSIFVGGRQPVDWLVAETVGIDKYESHVPFYGDKVISQQFTAASETLSRIDILVVSYKKKAPSVLIVLRLYEEPGHVLVRTVSSSGAVVKDDHYLPFIFAAVPKAAGRTFSFTVTASDATSQAPYAVRLTETGDVAFSYYQNRTSAFVAGQWFLRNLRQVSIFVLITGIGIWAAWLVPRAAAYKGQLRLLMVLILVAGTLLQINTIRWLAGDPGGDAYYYLVAANQIVHGVNPLASLSFRLPVYSALLIPATFPGVPDLLWGRAVGVLATAGVALVLMYLSASLDFRPVVGALAAAILYLSSDYVLTGLRPRPHAVFAFLLLFCLVLLFRIRTIKQAAGWGVALGLMGMTRQEAYPPIVIMGVAFFVMLVARRLPPTKIALFLAAAALPMFIIVSPYFYYNFQQYGNPWESPYFHQTGTPTAKTWEKFSSNIDEARGYLNRIWLPSSNPGISLRFEHNIFPGLAVSLLAYVIFHACRRCQSVQKIKTGPMWEILGLMATAGIVVVLWRWLLNDGRSWEQEINYVMVVATVIGVVELLRVGRWRGLVIVAVMLSQLAAATWFNPIPRLYQSAYPLLALGVVAILLPLFGVPTAKRDALSVRPWLSGRVAPLFLLVGLLGTNSIINLDNAIDALNHPAAPYYVATTAAERMEDFEGRAAAEVNNDEGDGIYSLHSYQQYRFQQFEEDISVAEQWQWLCANNIQYVVDNDDLDRLAVLYDEAYRSKFRFLFEEKTVGRDDSRYRVSVHEFTGREDCP